MYIFRKLNLIFATVTVQARYGGIRVVYAQILVSILPSTICMMRMWTALEIFQCFKFKTYIIIYAAFYSVECFEQQIYPLSLLSHGPFQFLDFFPPADLGEIAFGLGRNPGRQAGGQGVFRLADRSCGFVAGPLLRLVLPRESINQEFTFQQRW